MPVSPAKIRILYNAEYMQALTQSLYYDTGMMYYDAGFTSKNESIAKITIDFDLVIGGF